MKKITYYIYALLITPLSVFAVAPPKDVTGVVNLIDRLILDFIPFIFAIAVGGFLQGLIKFINAGDNEEQRATGRTFMIWGIIAIFFMVSFWGFVKISTNSFGFKFGIPQFKE